MASEKDTVAVGYVHPDHLSAWFHSSLVNLVLADVAGPRRLVAKIGEHSSANISNARNDIVRKFLTTSADWLWMVDSDMVFPVDILEELLANADPERAPIVGGLCFGTDEGRLFPTLYTAEKNADGRLHPMRYGDYPTDAMFQVIATGAACTLVHRSVYERIQERGYNKTYPWYQETEWAPGMPCSEDITFCVRAGQLGIPIWVDTAAKLGHHKSHLLDEALFRAQTPVSEGDRCGPTSDSLS